MSVVIENLGGIQRSVQLTISAESIAQSMQKRFKDLATKVRIDGFRRGKVPVKIIEERYGDSVYSEVLSDLVNDLYSEVLKEQNVIPAGAPKISPLHEKIEKNQPFTFSASFEVFPEITLKPFSELTVEKIASTLTEADIDKAIEKVREQRATTLENGDKQLPELDDAFISSLGVKGGLSELKQEVQKNLERELKYTLKNKLKQNVIDQLVAVHEFEIPEALVSQEAERMREQSQRYFKQMGSKINLPEMPLDLFKDNARTQVRIGLLFSEILDKLKIEVTQEKIDERIHDMATMYDDLESAMRWISNDKAQMENIRAQVREDMLIDKVLEEAVITEKTLSYEELMTKSVKQ